MWLQENCFFVIVFLCSSQYVFGLAESDPLVDTKVGLIRGLSATDGNYSMFMGIPYAKIDENNPFGDAIPSPKFDGIFEASDDSARCPQFTSNQILGSLDCLRLNIYVPSNASSQNKVPIMVFIHGGFFNAGFSGRQLYGPKYLVQHDVILVTINYRLGPYGFMCLDIPEVPGNQGLKDQVLALKWVNENLEAFGGDTNQITLVGHSAGAHALDFHLIYGDENLYQNVILQSGSSLASTVIIDPERLAPLKMAEYLGLTTNSITEALSFLTNLDSDLVIDTVQKLKLDFKPCIEKKFDGVDHFITESWINVKKPKVKGKPILLGFTEYERLNTYNNPEDYVGKKVFHNNIDVTFNFNKTQLEEMGALLHLFYIGGEVINEDTRLKLITFDSDYTYVYPMQRSLERFLQDSPKNVYYYMFSYVGHRNSGGINAEGAIHGGEMAYLFDVATYRNQDLTPEDARIIQQMTTMWTNFVKYGNPTPVLSDLLPTKWTPLSEENYFYLNIDTEITLESRPAQDRMAFWNLFYMLNEKSQKLYVDIE